MYQILKSLAPKNSLLALRNLSLLMLLALTTNWVAAEEEAVAEEQQEPLMYFQINPDILTFYQDTGRKIGYIVVQIQVVVRGQEHFDLVETHLPQLQDALIDFFNRQDKTTIQQLDKREELRQQAGERVAEVLKLETGKDVVENLLFTRYIFQ